MNITDTLIAEIDRQCDRFFKVSIQKLTKSVIQKNLANVKVRINDIVKPNDFLYTGKYDEADCYYQRFRNTLKKPKDVTRSIATWDFVCFFFLSMSAERACKKYKKGECILTLMEKGEAQATPRVENIKKNIPKDEHNAFNDLHRNAEKELLPHGISKGGSYNGFVHATLEYWEHLRNSSPDTIKLLNRYYTHLDSRSLPAILAHEGLIVEPPILFNVSDDEGNLEYKSINQIIETSLADQFSLVKILGEGGTGKSTFGYWLAKRFGNIMNVLIISKTSMDTVNAIIEYYETALKASGMPLMLIIDDVASSEMLANLKNLIDHLGQYFLQKQSIIIVVIERDGRYKAKIGLEVDKFFSGATQKIKYVSPSKDQIFNFIYDRLESLLKQSSEEIKEDANQVFCDPKVTSISESTYRLLRHLALTHDVYFEFDWNEWDKFIIEHPQFSSLKNLFLAVATFHQFGIKMPIDFSSKSLDSATGVKITQAIAVFGNNNSPIRLNDSNDKFLQLSLKNEYIANWYFHEPDVRRQSIQFFKEFLDSVTTNEQIWLLRQFRKILKSEEFLSSAIGQLLNPSIYIQLAKKYIDIPNVDKENYDKMRMEIGMVLLSLDKNEALKVFESIAKEDVQNNHARDQLARHYSNSPTTYNIAAKLYLEIFNNKGYYAFRNLHTLSIKGKILAQQDSTISVPSFEEILKSVENVSDEIYNSLIKDALLNMDFSLAEGLLNQQKTSNIQSAQHYMILSKSLPYSKENIEKKKHYYERAIAICNIANDYDRRIAYSIDYATFYFRMRKFSISTEMIEKICSGRGSGQIEDIKNKYWNKIASTTKLYFLELDGETNTNKIEKFLLMQCSNATAQNSIRRKDVISILQGYLMLKTVKVYSLNKFQTIYDNASKLIAYCHARHANENWLFGVTVYEHRCIAENLYDRLIRIKYPLQSSDYMDLLKNLWDFQEDMKCKKILGLTLSLFESNPFLKKKAFCYRYRGNAYYLLEDYDRALAEYQFALINCKLHLFKNEKHFVDEKAFILNNIAELVCTTVKKDRPLPKANLRYALACINEALAINPNREFIHQRKAKILSLLKESKK